MVCFLKHSGIPTLMQYSIQGLRNLISEAHFCYDLPGDDAPQTPEALSRLGQELLQALADAKTQLLQTRLNSPLL